MRVCGRSRLCLALAAALAASLAGASSGRAAGTLTFTLTLGASDPHTFFAGTPYEVTETLGTATNVVSVALGGSTTVSGFLDQSLDVRVRFMPKDAPAQCNGPLTESFDLAYPITIGSETHVVTQRYDVTWNCTSLNGPGQGTYGTWTRETGTTASFTVNGTPIQVTPQGLNGVISFDPNTPSPSFRVGEALLFSVGTEAPPHADAGPDQTVTVTDPATRTVAVRLDGSASSDPNGDPLTYTWTGGFVGGIATGVRPTVTFGVFGEQTVTLTVSDGQATATDTVVIRVLLDKTGPVVSGPSSVVVEATGPSGARVDYPLTASDPSGAYLAHCDPDSPGMILAIGTHVETCVFADGFGNATTVTLTAIVQDTTPPRLSGTPADPEAEATGPEGAVVRFSTP
ncbi:MAG TPA: PKD domain-containing protein, partial [Gaiellaceae bacterium]|nr:PKD domain-containing protein [Gaiellaceae bacterium]